MADDEDKMSLKKGVAEFFGTFALIYIGVLAIYQVVVLEQGDLTTIAFAHGLAIAVLVSATMTISGGQLNPAVTLGLLVARKIDARQAGINVGAQLLGGVIAGYLALVSLGGDVSALSTGTPALGTFGNGGGDVTVFQGILIETVLTFFLVFVVFGTAVDPRFGGRIGGLAIGLTVALDIMAGGPLTGAAMNPARWLGSALPGQTLEGALVYTIGPLLGGVLAGLLWAHVLLEGPRPHPEPQAQMRAKDNP